ncbi:MAG: ribonuclease P [Hadesarchaea archaeon]|nr:ribonuclease P [Hadesarchaea archaeon]
MSQKNSNRKVKEKDIALQRVEILLNRASEVLKKRPKLAHRYAEIAWKLKKRHNLEFPERLKRKICRKCQSFWVPDVTCRVRTQSSRPPHVVITCLECGYKKRVPYKERG